MFLKLEIQQLHLMHKFCPVCSYDDFRLTFDLFIPRTNLVPYDCVWENLISFLRELLMFDWFRSHDKDSHYVHIQ